MEAYTIQDLGNLQSLVVRVHGSDKPIVVLDGEDECVVAMRPSVFEHILFDAGSLSSESRRSLRI